MPVIKSAKKKLRKDIKRKRANDMLRANLSITLKNAKRNPSEKIISQASKALDKASKNGIIHKNKAARLKSKLSRLIITKTKIVKTPKAIKKTPKKTAKKRAK